MARADAIKVDVRLVDRATAPLTWMAFQLWESWAARHGSGLTKDQMTGARLYHEWLNREEKRVPGEL